MENSNERLNCKDANQIALVDYLSSLGIESKNKQGNERWYISPFRDEKTTSFKVDVKLNVWTDFGEAPPPGKKVCGGTLVDFAIRYHKCTVSEFLYNLERSQTLPTYQKSQARDAATQKKEEQKIIVTEVKALSDVALLKYISHDRRIPFHIADQFSKQVHFTLNGHPNIAIGFKNVEGGYELRNKYLKVSSSPKSYTYIQTGPVPADEIAVTEGSFSLYSYLTLIPPSERPKEDLLVLNSTVFFQAARKIMETYKSVNLFMDNNPAGQRITNTALSIDRGLYKDKSFLYKGYEDFNDYHCNFGRTLKKAPGLKP